MKVSIIVPALNEADSLGECLQPLQGLRGAGHEIIVVDGGSTDGTPAVAAGLADRVLESPRGRARQMNKGARSANGKCLLFLHADTRVAAGDVEGLAEALGGSGRNWGWFDVRLSGRHPMFRVIERLMSWRARLTGIASGDQAMFVTRQAFMDNGGFADIELMEDIEFSGRLRLQGSPLRRPGPVVTSSRRWEERGVWRTIWLMWRLRLAFALGALPSDLARRYGT